MTKHKITIEIQASDILQANLIKEGIKNVVNELGDKISFLEELADKNVARSYKEKLIGIIENPIVKRLAGIF